MNKTFTTLVVLSGVSLFVLAICLFSAGLLFVLQFPSPNRDDSVRLFVENIPEDVCYLSIIAESNGELKNMEWRVPNPWMGGRQNMHPKSCLWSIHDNGHPRRIQWDAYVGWELGGRYGVVTMNRQKEWSVTWFDADEVPLKVGGEKMERRARFDLARRKKEILPEKDVLTLGLDKVEVPL